MFYHAARKALPRPPRAEMLCPVQPAIALILLLLWAAPATQPAGPVPALPARPPDAKPASVVLAETAHLPLADREARWVAEILAGNVPAHLRQPVRVETDGGGGVWVLPDYLALGSDDDWVRLPLTVAAATQIAQALGANLPTREIVDSVWAAADERLEPIPLAPWSEPSTLPDAQRVDRRESVAAFLTHHRLIEAARGPIHGRLVAGAKKDLILTQREGRVTLYGWHRRDGRPIQPVSSVHGDRYVDYSHGVRLVWAEAAAP